MAEEVETIWRRSIMDVNTRSSLARRPKAVTSVTCNAIQGEQTRFDVDSPGELLSAIVASLPCRIEVRWALPNGNNSQSPDHLYHTKCHDFATKNHIKNRKCPPNRTFPRHQKKSPQRQKTTCPTSRKIQDEAPSHPASGRWQAPRTGLWR